jgi:anti-sigma regulatory factor (Ser/Thr protein kinase)
VIDERTMIIEPHPERLQEAREWAALAAADAGFAEVDSYQVKLAVSELVTNAIQHGSPRRAGTIHLRAYADDGRLVFEVRDNGEFVAPVGRASLDDESGRGLELVALLMDELNVTSTGDGSILRCAKRL